MPCIKRLLHLDLETAKPFDEMAGQLGGRHPAMTCPHLWYQRLPCGTPFTACFRKLMDCSFAGDGGFSMVRVVVLDVVTDRQELVMPPKIELGTPRGSVCR